MKKVFFIILFLSASISLLAKDDFCELKGTHFIVYYYPEHLSFAKEVLLRAEKYYVDIAKDLGYERYSQFWLWDRRVKIYIYPDHESYLKASNMPSWSHGMADYVNRLIMSYFRGEGFLVSILPHEITHLMFRDFVGFTGQIPLWLDEGVAQWEEKPKRHMKKLMRDALKRKVFLSLRDMIEMDVKSIKSDDKIYVRYTNDDGTPLVLILTGKNLINLYYLEAVSLVGFLIEKYGNKRFTNFCRCMRDGKSIEGALRSSYSGYLNTLEDLEKEWKGYYRKK